MTRHRKYQQIIVLFLTLAPLLAPSILAEDQPADETPYMSIEEGVNAVLTSIASKKQEKIADAPGVISIITQDELKRFGGTTLADILKRVPSFLGTTIYMTDRSVIASRGDQIMASSSHNLLLINGRPIREVLEGGIKSEMYESFPLSVIDRIEIIRGPGSVLYGSQAISAVINIITKSAGKNTISVSGALGEHWYKNVMADLQYKIGNFGLVAGGRFAHKEDWKTEWRAPGLTKVYTNEIKIPDYGPGLYGELSYTDKRFLNFRYMASYCQWENHFYIPDFQYLVDNPQSGVTEITGRATWRKFFNDCGYSLETSKNYKLNANLTFTRSWFETHTFPDVFRDAYEIIGELTNFFTPIDKLNIILGGVWGFMTGIERDPAIESLVYNDGHKQNTFSGYTQIDYHWEWCKIIGGIQANKVGDFKVDFNPRGGLIFYPVKHVNIKALYSTAFRAPSLNELYLDYPEMKGKKLGEINPAWTGDKTFNDTLHPEKVYTFDVGATYQDEKALFGINAFHSRLKSLIFHDRSGKYLHPTYDNLGDITIFGLECEGSRYLTKSILFECSFLYQQSRDENTGEGNVTPLPDFSAKGGLSYRSEFGLTISAFNTFQQALDQKYRSALNKTTKHFNMTNVHCSYDFNKLFKISAAKELSLVLNIDNLLDEEVWLPAWGLLPGSTIPYNQGRTIYGGFKVAF